MSLAAGVSLMASFDLDTSNPNDQLPSLFSSAKKSKGKPKKTSVAVSSRTSTVGTPTSSLLLGQSTLQSDSHATNEDRATFELVENGIIDAYAAVFDGHGGNACSHYVHSIVGKHVKSHFCSEEAWVNGEEVMQELFHSIDREFMELAMREQEYSGACATIAVVKDDEIIVGNIGDCRALMVPLDPTGGYGPPVEITVDHRAGSTSENLRINEAGGKVQHGRVCSLEPSRSFGDLDVKMEAGEDVVIAAPDVDRVFVRRTIKKKRKSLARIRSKEIEGRAFMVIATDGVWDDLSNSQVSASVKKSIEKFSYGRPSSRSFSISLMGSKSKRSLNGAYSNNDVLAETCAANLVTLAQQKGSEDDITAVVVLF